MIRPGAQWVVLVIATVVGFGAVAPDFYMAADDLFATALMHRLDHGGSAGLLDKLYGVFFRADGEGHFRPVQDVVWVVFYALFGIDHWLIAMTIMHALCHIASARLIIAILTRLGCSPNVAFASGLLFALHPVLDESIVSVQYGYNVPALTSMLGACYLWLPVGAASSRQSFTRIAASAALVYVAMGFAINMMVSGAVLLGLMAVAIGRQRRSARDVVVRGAALITSIGIGILHRLAAYGAIGTLCGNYQYLEPSFAIGPFLEEFVDGQVLLEPSPTMTWAQAWNPPGNLWDDVAVPLFSADSAVVAVLAIGLVALILARWPAGRAQASKPQREGLTKTLLFGLALMVSMALPYYLFVGSTGPHRYLYPATAGVAITASAIGAAAARAVAGLFPRVTTVLGAIILMLVFGAPLRVDREAARSIAAGHRMTRAIVTTVANEIVAHPEIKHVFVAGYPHVIGRAGYTILFPSHLLLVLNAKLGTHMIPTDVDYVDAVLSGAIPGPLSDEIALFFVEPGGTTVRRVSKPGDIGPLREGYLALSRAWHLEDDAVVIALLHSPDPRVVNGVLAVLFDLEDGARSNLVIRAFGDSVVTPALMHGVLRAARLDAVHGRGLAARVAVRASEAADVETAALTSIARGNEAFDVTRARNAIDLERKAWLLRRDPRTAAEAVAALLKARAAWADSGVPRDDLTVTESKPLATK